MQVLIVGSGRLASELSDGLLLDEPFFVHPWSHNNIKDRSILVHAGSGRELEEAVRFCEETGSVLIELATGSSLEGSLPSFPVVLCPNTNILMLKVMHMLASSGHLFKDYRIAITESHQAEKRSTPGTAVSIAQFLGVSANEVVSIRNPDEQMNTLHIPKEALGRHAFHSIRIMDAACSVSIETLVQGATPYVDGVAKIIVATATHQLESRIYEINEFVASGWL